MKGLTPLFLGIFGTFVFSWTGLTFIPNYQIGHLDPQMDEDGNDVYPMPKSGMAERGRKVYVANGCVYCHSQQVRADYAASDIERKWGNRRSAPRDYIFDRPVLLGKCEWVRTLRMSGSVHRMPMRFFRRVWLLRLRQPRPLLRHRRRQLRLAQPLLLHQLLLLRLRLRHRPLPPLPPLPRASPAPAAASSAPAPAAPPPPEEKLLADDGSPLVYTAAWHHRHLYNPRSFAPDSNMPAFRFLYEKRRISGEAAGDAVNFIGDDRDKPEAGWEIVPTYDAQCLVAYLMSLDQSHALKEVKSSCVCAGVAAAPGKGATK